MLRHPAMCAARWGRPNERHVAGRKRRHARLVAEDASAAELAAGVDGKHRDLFAALRDQIFAERFNQAALAGARALR